MADLQEFEPRPLVHVGRLFREGGSLRLAPSGFVLGAGVDANEEVHFFIIESQTTEEIEETYLEHLALNHLHPTDFNCYEDELESVGD